ncbi:MAG: dienelactone hydrolase family protein [Acidobacteria bacterium]|nr:dienelactone hydrolase family protein [Acidobacteriota bacterium]MBV9068466.1 dienelactone hydrolase family protein [Acidobacteriota bacterium]MBV9187380.1 dienelactone hydrolase family protein [Acidobacteriota bacterium]
MGERIEFPSNGHTCQGYFAGQGPGIVVIQEWWGLVPHIEEIVDRFAGEGFCAIAPDLYHGKTTTSPDEAGRLLMEIDADRAEKEIAAAGAYLLSRPECTSKSYGVVGFCMGGALAQFTATKEENVGAAVSFYGGFKKVASDWSNLTAPILLIYAEADQGVPIEQGRALAKQLEEMGKDVRLLVYPKVGHAFFNNTGGNYNAEAAEDAWQRTVEFFRAHLT